jgi:hypothetical protein
MRSFMRTSMGRSMGICALEHKGHCEAKCNGDDEVMGMMVSMVVEMITLLLQIYIKSIDVQDLHCASLANFTPLANFTKSPNDPLTLSGIGRVSDVRMNGRTALAVKGQMTLGVDGQLQNVP